MTTRFALVTTPLLILLVFLFAQATRPGLAQSNDPLAGSGSLAGRVLDSQGKPVAQIRVLLYHLAENEFDWLLFAYMTTTEDGAYGFRALPAGSYRLGFVDLRWPEQYAPAFYQQAATLATATNITLSEGAQLTGINMQLYLNSQMTGVVTNQQGQPIPYVSVRLYRDPNHDGQWAPTADSSQTDRTGAYRMTNLSPGRYRVEFTNKSSPSPYQPEFYNDALTLRAATTLTLSEGITLSGINAQLGPSGRIHGQVRNVDGQPVSNMYVALYVAACTECIDALQTITTDAAGFYTFTGVIAGSYHVGFSLWGERGNTYYYHNATQKADATTIAVTAGAIITGIHAKFPTLSVLSGSVTGPAGQPLPQIRVTALRELTTTYGIATWPIAAHTATSADGRYVINNLLAGRYRLRFTDQRNDPHLYSSQYYSDALYLRDAALITLTNKITISNLNVQLAGVGQISGQVQNTAGAPLSNIMVIAWPLPNEFDRGAFNATTGADGHYTLIGVDIGTYTIRFADTTWPSRYIATYYHDDVVVAADAHVTAIDAQLMPDTSAVTPFQLWLPLIYQ